MPDTLFNPLSFQPSYRNRIALPRVWPPRGVRTALWVGLLLGLLLLGACGPASGANKTVDTASAEEQTQAIARDFAADGDLEKARTAVNALGVANPGQWFIFMTEGAVIDPARDPALTRAMVRLALELGYKEATIEAYARANGLADTAGTLTGSQAAADAATVAAAIVAPVPAAAPVAAAPAADTQPVVAPVLTATAPLTAALVSTGAATTLPAAGPTADVQPTAAAIAEPAAAQPAATANELINLRLGPGVEYSLAGSLAPGDAAAITGKNATGDWWQVRTTGGVSAWVYAQLVTSTGPVESVALAADIPAAPTATPAPIAAAPAAPAEEPTAAPAAEPAEPAAPAPSASDQPTFRKIDSHLWSKEENGSCTGQHLLRIIVVDANNNPLNGVTLQGIYTGMILVTGSQGKGDGRIEYDLYGTGEGFKVIKDVDGRDAVSDNAEGFTTKSLDIGMDTLIAAGYCADETSCQQFYSSYGCTGHHSWQATFQRNY